MTLKNTPTPPGTGQEPIQNPSLDQQKIKELIEARRAAVVPAIRNSANPAKNDGCHQEEAARNEQVEVPCSKEWPPPTPFNQELLQESFPIEVLPPLLRDAILEVQWFTQAPMAMVASSAICTTATAIQGLVDACRPSQLHGPASLFFFTLGDSGERKSTVDKYFSKPLKDHHEKSRELAKPILSKHLAQLEAWQAQCEGVKSAIKNASRSGHIEDVETEETPNKGSDRKRKKSLKELKQLLEEIYDNKPVRPLLPNLLITDITTEKLQYHLSQIWPSCLLCSAEGGLVLGGRSMSKENETNTLSSFNALWSDEVFRVSRKNAETFEVVGARFSLSLLVQPNIFAKFIEDHPTARENGFFARCLFSYPESTQGTRLFRDRPAQMPGLDAYYDHITMFLNYELRIVEGILKTSELDLTPEASEIWKKYYNEIEIELRKNGLYEAFRDFGSKSAENAARLATVFQACKGSPLISIDKESMAIGCKIAHWYLNEAFRYFAPLTQSNKKNLSEAKSLLDSIVNIAKKNGQNTIERSLAMTYAPNSLRKKEKFDPIIDFLEQNYYIRSVKTNKNFIEINPSLLE